MKQQPHIELLTHSQETFSQPGSVEDSKPPKYRLKIFTITFLLVLLLGLAINFMRPAVYQSSATLLTSAATAIDQISSEVDFQHVAIQRQKLLSFELLTETLARLKQKTDLSKDMTLPDLVEIRNMLVVEPVEQTNLLSMVAEGNNPELLPLVINTWIDVYLDARAQSVENATTNTKSLVAEELLELDRKVDQAAQDLDTFRKLNDISSTLREENDSAAKLTGLNTALNTANEEVVKAKAKLDAINQAIAAGRAVVPDDEQRSLSNLEKRLQELKEKLAEFDKRYTRQYLALQPSLKFIPEQIIQLEKEINVKHQTGKQMVWNEASQEYYAAQQVVRDIKQQLDEHKLKASEFTTLFAHHQKLIDDLTALQEIQRETRDRLVKLESKQYDKYPQVDVVERASVNRQSIRPDYAIGSLMVFIFALTFAFFIVWLYEFLNRGRPQSSQTIFPIQNWFATMIPPGQQDAISAQSQQQIPKSDLNQGLPYEHNIQVLTTQQIDELLTYADADSTLLILLLLTGLTIDDIVDLSFEQVDLEAKRIEIDGDSPRVLQTGERIITLLAEAQDRGKVWQNDELLLHGDFVASLYCVAQDAKLVSVAENLADVLRDSYIIYLLQQGIRLNSLANVVGPIAPRRLAGFAEYVRSEVNDDINYVHPACN
jgi:polysaccharide biosynthesis transport protein